MNPVSPESPPSLPQKNILFVTGTDTDVGKSVVSVRLIQYLRFHGIDAMAIKPFCSGATTDLDLLIAANDRNQSHSNINLYYHDLPLSPMTACLTSGSPFPDPERVDDFIQSASGMTDWLVIEGAGGLFTPLAPDYFIASILKAHAHQAILVAPDRLGCLNHSILSLQWLKNHLPNNRISLILNRIPPSDLSSESNLHVITTLFPNQNAHFFPQIEGFSLSSIKSEKKLKKPLAGFITFDKVLVPSPNGTGSAGQRETEKSQSAITSHPPEFPLIES